jgi:hypothetical protein
MLWGASLALVLTHFVAPRTATTHFSALLVPLFLLLRIWQYRNGRYSAWIIAGLMPLIAVASWALFLITVRGRFESALNYLPIPLALLISLVLVRSRWKAVVGAPA